MYLKIYKIFSCIVSIYFKYMLISAQAHREILTLGAFYLLQIPLILQTQ